MGDLYLNETSEQKSVRDIAEALKSRIKAVSSVRLCFIILS